MRPTVGRIVHYTNLGDRDGKYPPEVQAAIITKVRDGHGPGTAHACSDEHPYVEPDVADETRYEVSLHVFYPTGQFDMSAPFTGEPAGSDGARGKWAWPARE